MTTLKDFAQWACTCREGAGGLSAFLRSETVSTLDWPADVIEQWLYDHAGHVPFEHDYGSLDLAQIDWGVEAIATELFVAMPTGPSEARYLDEIAKDWRHWLGVRTMGIHRGAQLAWDTHGTWKRWPILLHQDVLTSPTAEFQLVEGRTRVGILRGRSTDGELVASRHLAWVGRRRDNQQGRTSTAS